LRVALPERGRRLRAASVALAAVVLTGCGTKQHTYSAEEVRTAFAGAGLPLTAAAHWKRNVLSRWNGTLLVGRAGDEMLVLVYDRADSAERAYEIVRDQATPHSLDRLERNVLLTSHGLSRAERRRALAAIAGLRRSHE
jgi:hypothetical protein